MKSTDVIISGGGVPGLTLGILLAKAGLDVVLFDPSPRILPGKVAPSGRTIALMENSLSILDQAGLLANVENKSQDLKTLSIVDRDFRADFHCAEVGKHRFGQNVQNALLLAHAAKMFTSFKNTTLIQEKLEHFEVTSHAVKVQFSKGNDLAGKIIIGADGRNSFVRQSSGISVWEHDYDQTALTGMIRHEKPHRAASTEFHFSGGPFTIVPMQGNTSSFVWMEKTSEIEKYLSLDKSKIEKIMVERTQGLVGKISLVTAIDTHPVKIQKARSLISHRMALIAEAAHVLSPIGAQGMNLSLRDVDALAAALINAARMGLDIGSAEILRKYEQDRYLDLNLRIAGTDALNRSVATDSVFFNRLKNFGLKAARNIAPLRSVLVNEALAPQSGLMKNLRVNHITRATVSTSIRKAPAA